MLSSLVTLVVLVLLGIWLIKAKKKRRVDDEDAEAIERRAEELQAKVQQQRESAGDFGSEPKLARSDTPEPVQYINKVS